MNSSHTYTTPTASQKGLIRQAILSVLVLGSIASSGCTSCMAMSAKMPMDAIAKYSPAAQVVSPTTALDNAAQYVKTHPGSDFAIGRGDSMLPLYHDRAVIILDRPALANLKVGQTVVFVSQAGLPVAHILLRHTSDGWVTMGLNNPEADPGVLTDSRYVGVVVKAYQPTASVILAYAASANTDNTFASIQ